MDGREGFDLAKMAIAVLILIILVSVVVGLFHMLYTPSVSFQEDVGVKANNAVMDKLYGIQDISNAADADAAVLSTEEIIAAHPLVTLASSAISELGQNDLLFVFVCENKNTVTSNGWMFTYDSVVFNNTSVLPCIPTHTVDDSSVPTDMAVKHLLQYSKSRCHLSVVDVDYGGQDYYGVIVEVLT